MPFVFVLSCKKDSLIVTPPTLPPKVVDTDTLVLTCQSYTYSQFTRDSFPIDPAHQIIDWEYVNSNTNEIIYILYNQHQLWYYNLATKERKFLADQLLDNAYANRRGWVTFSKLDWNVYKIKLNGDSLTQLTFDRNSFYPKWDYTDTAIYFFNEQKNQSVKIAQSGRRLDSTNSGGYFQGISRHQNLRAYSLPYQGSVTDYGIYIMDMSTKTETLLTHGGLEQTFDGFCFDNNDEYIYGLNDSAIMRININTKVSELFSKYCPNYSFGRLHIASGIDKLTCGWNNIIQITKPHRWDLHNYRAVEFALNDPVRKPKEVKPYK